MGRTKTTRKALFCMALQDFSTRVGEASVDLRGSQPVVTLGSSSQSIVIESNFTMQQLRTTVRQMVFVYGPSADAKFIKESAVGDGAVSVVGYNEHENMVLLLVSANDSEFEIMDTDGFNIQCRKLRTDAPKIEIVKLVNVEATVLNLDGTWDVQENVYLEVGQEEISLLVDGTAVPELDFDCEDSVLTKPENKVRVLQATHFDFAESAVETHGCDVIVAAQDSDFVVLVVTGSDDGAEVKDENSNVFKLAGLSGIFGLTLQESIEVVAYSLHADGGMNTEEARLACEGDILSLSIDGGQVPIEWGDDSVEKVHELNATVVVITQPNSMFPENPLSEDDPDECMLIGSGGTPRDRLVFVTSCANAELVIVDADGKTYSFENAEDSEDADLKVSETFAITLADVNVEGACTLSPDTVTLKVEGCEVSLYHKGEEFEFFPDDDAAATICSDAVIQCVWNDDQTPFAEERTILGEGVSIVGTVDDCKGIVFAVLSTTEGTATLVDENLKQYVFTGLGSDVINLEIRTEAD